MWGIYKEVRATAQDFDVTYMAQPINEDGVLVTGLSIEEMGKRENEILTSALEEYNALKRPQVYSVSPNDSSSSTTLTLDTIDQLAVGINSNLSNLASANQIILQNVSSDPLMSYAHHSIMANIPSDYTVSYVSTDGDGRDDNAQYDETKQIVERFNRDIKMPRLIRNIVETTWLEGNTPLVLRTKDGTGVIDILPLDILHPSAYRILGDDVMQCEISTLKNRLTKTYPKTKRTRKSVYFDNLQKEVEANFSPEIVKAYKDGETLCRMPVEYADCVKVNSCNRQYGVSPFFCALRPLTLLKTLESADANEAKARSKYIIFQKLRKDLLGPQGQYKGLAEQVLAHDHLMSALKTNLAAYTAAPWVESVEFVSADSTGEDSVKLNTTYTTKYLNALGISWSNTEMPNGTMANLSISNLIKSINVILKEIERVMNKFYLTVLKDNGIDMPKFLPELHIAKAESIEQSLKRDLAQFAYSTLNCSRTTAYKILDMDVENEAYLRQGEKDKGYEDIFTPHLTSYTTSGSSQSSGRPQSTDEDADVDKQDYDADRYRSGE